MAMDFADEAQFGGENVIWLGAYHICTAFQYKTALKRQGRVMDSHAGGQGSKPGRARSEE